MKIPRSVTIGGKRISVRIDKELDGWGEYHHDLAKITLCSRCLDSDADTISTLRHEMLHAALAVSGMSFSEVYSEESIVRCLDEIFFPSWIRVEKKLKT